MTYPSYNSLVEQRKLSRKTKRTPGQLGALNDRHREIIALMVYKGQSDNAISQALGIRPGYVFALRSDPVFKMEYDRQVQLRKDSLKPKALERLDGLLDAEDPFARLGAVKVTLSEPKQPAGVNVNVAVNQTNQTNVSFRPGYVLRLPPTINHSPDGAFPSQPNEATKE